jgi:hypothetical protein
MQIYKITNKLNNKIYIGKDTTSDPNYFGSGKLISRALIKYGKENFKKEIIEECEDYRILSEREIFWINFFGSRDLKKGYNISKGGDGGDTISNNPDKEQIIDKIKNSMKRRVFSEKHRNNLSKNHASSKLKKGKSYEEIYGMDKAADIKSKLQTSRQKYKTEKERLGENYYRVIEILKTNILGDNNPMRKNKYYWYHNPSNNKSIRIMEGGLVPDGYVKGRKTKK